jgi:hypothetical protein
MSVIFPNVIHAMGSVAAGGAAFLASSPHPGFTSVANGGAGLNNLTLDQEVDATQSLILATPRSAIADGSVQTAHTSDSVKQVRTYLAGVLDDTIAFDVVVFRMPSI